ncbi:MAG: hypothetical protein GY772_03405 [bacterium]|nr:hypothetical protein [bacterium]
MAHVLIRFGDAALCIGDSLAVVAYLLVRLFEFLLVSAESLLSPLSVFLHRIELLSGIS